VVDHHAVADPFKLSRLIILSSLVASLVIGVYFIQVSNVMDGYHGCIFAYGQTSSGKTHTIHGVDGDPGTAADS
jgi:hypothetical protein